MTKERRTTLMTVLKNALNGYGITDPRGKPITVDEIMRAFRSFKAAARKETTRLNQRSAITRKGITVFVGNPD